MQYVRSCIDFISPAEHINTFNSSLSARLLIFVLHSSVVFSRLIFVSAYSPGRKYSEFFSRRASLTLYLREVIFFLLISLTFIPHVFSSDTLLCLHFSFSVAWSPVVSQRHRKSFHCYLVFNYFDLISESDHRFFYCRNLSLFYY